jgi:hypothetical protein
MFHRCVLISPPPFSSLRLLLAPPSFYSLIFLLLPPFSFNSFLLPLLTAFSFLILFILSTTTSALPLHDSASHSILTPLLYPTSLDPQGLPTTVTACLFIVAERMGQHNVFVKKLDIIETLGSCTLICTGQWNCPLSSLLNSHHGTSYVSCCTMIPSGFSSQSHALLILSILQ